MATAVNVNTEQPGEWRGWPTSESMQENLREVRRVVSTARRAAEGVAADAAEEVQRHPLRSIGTAVVAGAIVGSLVGFGVAWFARTPRRRWWTP